MLLAGSRGGSKMLSVAGNRFSRAAGFVKRAVSHKKPLRLFRSRMGECTSQPTRLVHSAFGFALICDAEACAPSIAVCSFFRPEQTLRPSVVTTSRKHCRSTVGALSGRRCRGAVGHCRPLSGTVWHCLGGRDWRHCRALSGAVGRCRALSGLSDCRAVGLSQLWHRQLSVLKLQPLCPH